MAGIIVQVDLFLLGGIKINTAGRIENKKNYYKNFFLPSYFIERN
jgi:hypothetical protein